MMMHLTVLQCLGHLYHGNKANQVWILPDANEPLHGIFSSITITCFTCAGLTQYFSEREHSFSCASMFRIVSFRRDASSYICVSLVL